MAAEAQAVGMQAAAAQQWWEWPWLVFRKLDARSLATVSCVCVAWREAGAQEELWRLLCVQAWPGLAASRYGMSAVKAGGGYRRFFSIRQRALQLSCASKLGYKPSLKLRDILFMIDINHDESTVCSFVRGGESLRPMFPAAAAAAASNSLAANEEQGTFRFVVTVQQRQGQVALGEDHEVWISKCRWSKQQVRDFTVSWAVMIKGGPKLFQILHTRQAGQALGNTCNYAERLPVQSCCCFSETNHVAEVDLYFSQQELGDGDEQCLTLQELRCSILNTDCWRYFTNAQALQYLEHALLHE